jgi:hypothetical protein
MMKLKQYITMAVLALAGTIMTGCSSEDITTEAPQPERHNKTVTLTTTITRDGSEATRALTAAGVKTFAVGDQIAVFYKNTNGETEKAESEALTETDIHNEGKNATFTVTLTDPAAGGAVRYIYPAAMAVETVGTGIDPTNDYNTIVIEHLKSQDGTLATIAANYDLAVYDGTLTDGATLPANATLQNRLAILELTVKNASGTSVNGSVTKFSVYDGTNYYRISRTASDEPIYVALRPVNSNQTITFSATDGTTNYRKKVTGKTLDRNNIYPVSLTMAETTSTVLEFLSGSSYTVQDGETLTGKLYGNTRILTPETDENGEPITVTLDGVDINGKSSYVHPGINCRGNVNLVLADGSVNHVTVNHPEYAGIFIKASRTLTISGNGSLNATGDGNHARKIGGAGIGGNNRANCGNIVITSGTIIAQGGICAAGIGCGCGAYEKNEKGSTECGSITITGGNVTATGGTYGAGIGSAYAYCKGLDAIYNRCGNILITGGTVTAHGGEYAAGIGCGLADGISGTERYVECGNITITSDVTSVTATKGREIEDSFSIGRGWGDKSQSCGTITIGGTVYWDGSAFQNDGNTYLATSPFTYQP